MVLKKIDLFTNEAEIINIIAFNYSINEIFTENKDIIKKVEKLKIKVNLIRSYQDLKKKYSLTVNLVSPTVLVSFLKISLLKNIKKVFGIYIQEIYQLTEEDILSQQLF